MKQNTTFFLLHLDLETIPNQNPEYREYLIAQMPDFAAQALDKYPDLGPMPDYANQVPKSREKDKDEWIAGKVADWHAKLEKNVASRREYTETKTAEYMRKLDESVAKTSFDGKLGHICTLGYALDDGPARTVSLADTQGSERAMLALFFEQLQAALPDHARVHLCGYNIMQFDLPFFLQRCIVLDVPIPTWFPKALKPWDDRVIDVMNLWSASKRNEYVKLDDLLSVTLEGEKGIGADEVYVFNDGTQLHGNDMDGAKVAAVFADGGLDKGMEWIDKYCASDVEQTRKLFHRMNRVLGVHTLFKQDEPLEPLPPTPFDDLPPAEAFGGEAA